MRAFLTDPDATIYLGDARTVLRELPSESVHCCVTSPPFYGLRDYSIKGQIGLEATPEEWVEHLVAVFREVRRVLRRDGTCWIEVGDSYAANRTYQVPDSKHRDVGNTRGSRVPDGLKAKDLIGTPFMLAFALRADGWWWRQTNIWWHTNCMPESVKDRPTSAHSYVFLLSKSTRYFYDDMAVAEPAAWDGTAPRSRNLRSVWPIPTQPFPDAHFATMPEAVVRPCILAGTSKHGCCPKCGAPGMDGNSPSSDCADEDNWPQVPCTVIDPFGGSGTTALVARKLGRRSILIELSPEYVAMGAERLSQLSLPSQEF